MNRKLLITLLYAISATYTLQAADADELKSPFSVADIQGKAYARFKERCAAYAATNKKPKEEIVTTQEEIDYWMQASPEELAHFCWLRKIPNPLKVQEKSPETATKILTPSAYEQERIKQGSRLALGLPTNTPPYSGRASKALSSKSTSRATTPLNTFRPINPSK